MYSFDKIAFSNIVLSTLKSLNLSLKSEKMYQEGLYDAFL
jgi:hypothetical protein